MQGLRRAGCERHCVVAVCRTQAGAGLGLPEGRVCGAQAACWTRAALTLQRLKPWTGRRGCAQQPPVGTRHAEEQSLAGGGSGVAGRAVGSNEHRRALCGGTSPVRATGKVTAGGQRPWALRHDREPTPPPRLGSGMGHRSFKRQRIPSGRGPEARGRGALGHSREAGLRVSGRETCGLEGEQGPAVCARVRDAHALAHGHGHTPGHTWACSLLGADGVLWKAVLLDSGRPGCRGAQ